MQLLNNRYKIEEFFGEDSSGTIYEVLDLWNGNKKVLLKLCDKNSQNEEIFDFFCNNFLKFSNIKYKYLQSNGKFDIVSVIDNKNTNKNQFYYIKEYINKNTLMDCHDELSFEDILDVIRQLCDVVDYFRFRGIVYEYISPTNINIVRENGRIVIKLKDLASVYELKIRDIYEEEIHSFIAPEVIINNDDTKKNADIYSIGMIMKFLLDKYLSVDKQVINKVSIHDIHNISILIESLTIKEPNRRETYIKNIIEEINKLSQNKYSSNYKLEREKLNFTTEIIGRDKELNEVLTIDNEFENRIYNKKVVTITGESGIGKTRLLEEIKFRFKMKGRDVYYTTISDENSSPLRPIIEILRRMINNCENSLIEKYGCELVKIIPELRVINDVKPSSMLSGDRERLRLYDRISNFLVDFVKNNPTYVIIDELQNSDLETINLINYIITNKKNSPLLFVFSFNERILDNNFDIIEIVKKWLSHEEVKKIELLRYDLNSTTLMVKNILGVCHISMDFVCRIMSETAGNLRHIEEIIKNLYASDELFIDKTGNWELKTQVSSNIYIPSNIDEAIKNHIDLLKEELYELAKIISVFRVALSKSIIINMIDIETEKLDKLINELKEMKIIDIKVEDWEYTYDFYNIQEKKYVYHRIGGKEREDLHKKAASILEKLFCMEKKRNIDELVYHLSASKQIDKAVRYTIDLAKKMDRLVGNSQAMSLWQKANDLLKATINENKLEVLVNLGRLYSAQGVNNNALEVFKEALSGAIILDNEKYIVMSSNSIGEIYYKKFDLNKAEKHIEKAKKIAKDIDYVEGYLESTRLNNVINLQKNNFNEIIEDIKKCLEIAKKEHCYTHVAHFYNQLGIVKLFSQKNHDARRCFENSIEYFHKAGDFVSSTKPINNIGQIYWDYYDNNEKAMEYYEKGLDICKKYNSFENELVFLNNIGEIFINNDDYDKAVKFLKDAERSAKEIEGKRWLFVININLARIYLGLGQYDKCFFQYHLIKAEYEKNPSQGEIVYDYYDFLGEFYFVFGKWEESLKYSIKAKENSAKKRIYLKAISRIQLIRILKENTFSKQAINKVRSQYRQSNFISLRRKMLLDYAEIIALIGKKDYAQELLLEDEEISSISTSEYLDLKRKIALNFSKDDDVNELLKLEENINNKNLELKIHVNKLLGERFYNNQECYQSLYYYIVSMDLLQRSAKKIPNDEMKQCYLKRHKTKKIIHIIGIIKDIISGNAQKENDSKNILDESLFDIKQFRQLFDSKEFFNVAFKHFNSNAIDDVHNIVDLVKHFTENYKYNLELILKYAVRETFANRGFIYTYHENSDKPKIYTSTTDNFNLSIVNQIASRSRQKKDGLLIKSDLESNAKKDVYLPDNVKALICMPIFRTKKVQELHPGTDRRKNYATSNSDEIIGCIYLDSDRLFNRFDEKRYEIIKALSFLAFINIDNCHLKISSSIDKMTGVYTRKYFDMISEDILNSNKINDDSLSVIMIDIDKFKAVNDTFGHRKGDEVLSNTGKIILDNVRSSDYVGRYGGEEFIILLPKTNKLEGKEIAEKIRKKIEEAELIGEEYPLTVSLGISVYPQHGQFMGDLIEKADQALYEAKESGRNKSVIWRSDFSSSNKRLDRLAGIVTGNTVQDQRNILALVEIIDLIKEKKDTKEKIYNFLGRLIEIIEGKYGALFILDEQNKISDINARQVFVEDWIDKVRYNEKIINRVIKNRTGEFLIDWEDVEDIDVITGTPNWQSLIVSPLIHEGKVKGVLQISVPIKEKEFDYNSYNLVKTIGDIIAAII